MPHDHSSSNELEPKTERHPSFARPGTPQYEENRRLLIEFTKPLSEAIRLTNGPSIDRAIGSPSARFGIGGNNAL